MLEKVTKIRNVGMKVKRGESITLNVEREDPFRNHRSCNPGSRYRGNTMRQKQNFMHWCVHDKRSTFSVQPLGTLLPNHRTFPKHKGHYKCYYCKKSKNSHHLTNILIALHTHQRNKCHSGYLSDPEQYTHGN